MLVRTVALGEPMYVRAPDNTLFFVRLEGISKRQNAATVRIQVESGAVSSPYLGEILTAYLRLSSSRPMQIVMGVYSVEIHLLRLNTLRAKLGFLAPRSIRISHGVPPPPHDAA